jgi:phosphohistidine phosphatase SixA
VKRVHARRGARAIVVAVAGLLLVAATGCGGGRPEPAATGTAASTASTAARGGLVASLRQGGYVIFIRHAATEATTDDPRPDLADPGTQRNLSAAGREQARQLGRAIRALRIPLGVVLVSPYARTRETAELAFGQGQVDIRVTNDLINEAYPGTDDDELSGKLRRLLSQRPPAGRNTVLVSHGFNLRGAVGLSIAEGESAVFQPQDGGGARLVARLTVPQWQAL